MCVCVIGDPQMLNHFTNRIFSFTNGFFVFTNVKLYIYKYPIYLQIHIYL